MMNPTRPPGLPLFLPAILTLLVLTTVSCKPSPYEQAVSANKTRRAMNSAESTRIMNSARELFLSGRPNEALKYLETNLKPYLRRDFFPENRINYHGLRGAIFAALGQHEKALSELASGLSNYTNEKEMKVPLHATRAQVYLDTGRLDQAEQEAKAAIELGPERSEGYLVRARIHLHRKAFDAALVDIDKVIGLNPDIPIAYFKKADILASLGRNEDAVNAYREYLERTPADENGPERQQVLQRIRTLGGKAPEKK